MPSLQPDTVGPIDASRGEVPLGLRIRASEQAFAWPTDQASRSLPKLGLPSAAPLSQQLLPGRKLIQEPKPVLVGEFRSVPVLLRGAMATDADSGCRVNDANREARAVRLFACPAFQFHSVAPAIASRSSNP